MSLFYLSFADNSGWLGACVIEGKDFICAVKAAHVMGINPGGEVMGAAIPPAGHPPAEFRERLLSKSDIAAMDKALGGDGVCSRWNTLHPMESK